MRRQCWERRWKRQLRIDLAFLRCCWGLRCVSLCVFNLLFSFEAGPPQYYILTCYHILLLSIERWALIKNILVSVLPG